MKVQMRVLLSMGWALMVLGMGAVASAQTTTGERYYPPVSLVDPAATCPCMNQNTEISTTVVKGDAHPEDTKARKEH